VRITTVCRLADSRRESDAESDQRCPAAAGDVQVATPFPSDFQQALPFEQCGRFKDRWTEFHTSSRVLQFEPGESTVRLNHSVGVQQVSVRLPPRGSGVHGVVVGDPCISSRYMPGLCNTEWDVINRLPQFLNLLNSVDPLDFIIVLGDAFYDVHGGLTEEFWRRLSKRTQQTFLLAVPGNHDFWMFAPQARLAQDQLGIGFAQWFAQDTASGHRAPQRPAPERLPPPSAAPRPHGEDFPSAEEFFFYHTIGDVGFMGYSGAHSLEEHGALFREACDFFVAEAPRQIYLLGHWSKADLGCQPGMDVPSMFQTLRESHCRQVADRMRYFMGHDHCNSVVEDGVGFLLGGGGAAHNSCDEWGVAYVDTRTSLPSGKGPGRRAFGHRLPQWRGGRELGAPSMGHLVAKVTLATMAENHQPWLESCLARQGALRACLAAPASELWVNDTRF